MFFVAMNLIGNPLVVYGVFMDLLLHGMGYRFHGVHHLRPSRRSVGMANCGIPFNLHGMFDKKLKINLGHV